MKFLEFYCPLCAQKLKAKQGRFECNHKSTTHQKKIYQDPDKYELDEVKFKLEEAA